MVNDPRALVARLIADTIIARAQNLAMGANQPRDEVPLSSTPEKPRQRRRRGIYQVNSIVIHGGNFAHSMTVQVLCSDDCRSRRSVVTSVDGQAAESSPSTSHLGQQPPPRR